ncbi:protein kinase-like domain-containing protein [Artemisia annua]|uniref:Protein kinase-like domain-containing protein n=1 Tax=Artemisia annua TaxID=35608 RepID=A0A2U1QHE9_ARTAN|nr:protein kinase-like domain-containing protein [Artemisia annua]
MASLTMSAPTWKMRKRGDKVPAEQLEKECEMEYADEYATLAEEESNDEELTENDNDSGDGAPGAVSRDEPMDVDTIYYLGVVLYRDPGMKPISNGKNIISKEVMERSKVYKGILWDGTVITIKRAEERSLLQGEKEFLTEIELLSRSHHRNLVSLEQEQVSFRLDNVSVLWIYADVGILMCVLKVTVCCIYSQIGRVLELPDEGYLDPEYLLTLK